MGDGGTVAKVSLPRYWKLSVVGSISDVCLNMTPVRISIVFTGYSEFLYHVCVVGGWKMCLRTKFYKPLGRHSHINKKSEAKVSWEMTANLNNHNSYRNGCPMLADAFYSSWLLYLARKWCTWPVWSELWAVYLVKKQQHGLRLLLMLLRVFKSVNWFRILEVCVLNLFKD